MTFSSTITVMFLNIIRLAVRVRNKVCSRLYARAFHRFGSSSVVCMPVRLGGERSIEIGNGVHLGANCWIEVMASEAARTSPVISIGDRTSISGDCTITAVSRVIVESAVLIARFVHISDHSHARGSDEIPIKDQGITEVAPVVIREGAWICHGVVICPGVTIGRNAVIGANSVVKQDVPDYSIAVGIPARILSRPESPDPS